MSENTTVVASAAIKGVVYEFNKKGVVDSFIAYLKQEIVWEEWKAWVLQFAEWLKVEKPELFTQNTSTTHSSASWKTVKKTTDANPKTQKAKGIKYISNKNAGFNIVPFEILTGEDRDDEAVDGFIKQFAEVFARPCPETPRHGFVDSRKVTGKDKIFELFRHVREVDPNGELVIMEPVNAEYNCVITGNSITIGEGHDGATAGIKARTFPIFGTWEKKFGNISDAGIAEDSVPYLETVTKGNSHYLVQMRGGPKITSRAVDFIPSSMVVSQVIKAQGDLLEWEKTMQHYAGQKGVIVDHTGGALTSHYGVHAILNNIAVVTSFTPTFGQLLEPVDDTVTHNYMSAVTGILDSLCTPYVGKSNDAKRVTSMIYATQYFSVLGGTDAYFIGHAVGTMLSFGLAACGGEYRHLPKANKKGLSRSQVYKAATKDFIGARMKLAKWARSFAVDYWSSGYGGTKWYDCADAIIQLDTATRRFLRFPKERHFKTMMMAMNRAINCAHNGGWWFNKFVDSSVFNHINSEHLPTILDAVTYMYSTQQAQIGLHHLEMYQRYSNAKVVDPKLEKTHVCPIIEAQIRPIAIDTQDITPENIGNSFRLQIKYEGVNGFNETAFEMDGSNWPFGQEQFVKSMASSVHNYIPVKFELNGDKWRLFIGDHTITEIPAKYGYAPLKKAKKKA